MIYMMKKGVLRSVTYPVILMVFWAVLIIITVPKGYIYGSTVDWFSQHTALAETIRRACLEQKTLLPAFLNLGGGSSGFAFSYYGYLRPDILFGCLMPDIPMYGILIVYMLLGYLAAVLLCYKWLNIETKSRHAAFFGSVLFLLAACFFHTHRQVMFINYMPYFMGALLSIKKKKLSVTVILLSLCCLNSFYYMPAIFAVIFWYWYRNDERYFLSGYLKAVLLSVGMTAALLIPTFFIIIEHHRVGTAVERIPGFLPEMNFLLYTPYGIGLTMICAYLLISGLRLKRLCKDSIFLLTICNFGIFAWLLNGGLYARGKILIPFLPLVIWQSVRVLLSMHKKEMKWQLWPFVFLLFCLYSCRSQKKATLMALDILILFLFCLGKRYFAHKEDSFKVAKLRCFSHIAYGMLFIMPLLFWRQAVNRESFVPLDMIQKIKTTDTCLPVDTLYRFDSLNEPLGTGNRDAYALRLKSSMYSSVTNQAYAKVYYDLLKTPIQINNRIALLPEENPFLLQLMGIRYLETTEDKVPDGYQIIQKRKDHVIAENSSVLPIAYMTDEIIAESDFWKLGELERLDVLTRYTVVKEVGTVVNEQRMNLDELKSSQQWREEKPAVFRTETSENLMITKKFDSSYEISAKGEATLVLYLEKPIKNDILMLEFSVDNRKNDAVVIDINGIRNKLSGTNAPYPNQNDRFHYQFSEGGEGITAIYIRFSSGCYNISDINWIFYRKELLTQKEYTNVYRDNTKPKEILSCKTANKESCYFVTSIPNQKGLKIFVDGAAVPVFTVNTAFAGAEVTAGAHDIKIVFIPPGLFVGKLVSICSMLLFAAYCGKKAIVRIRNKIRYILYKK